ncbi:MAG: HAD-IA family hydrolase [Pseudomonadales bacterium]|jgi:putative hydrolase of the HAD superfamily|nr:HAD-IA family hydrolase [Pseudomonadales bacterium]
MFKAVLWDFGGVITSSPFEAFNRFEADNGLPQDCIRGINATNPETNAWAQLESSQVSVDEFDELFAGEAKSKGYEIRGKQVLELLSGDIRPEMVAALEKIRQNHAIGCITNNVNTGEGPGMARSEKKASAIAEIMSMFEIVIESSKVGIRKPNPAIYELACKEMGITPEHAVYLDDLGINLKPARALGMTTIKVLNADQAFAELEEHLGMTLR